MAGIEDDWNENESASQSYRGYTDKMLTRNIKRDNHVFNGRYMGKTNKQDHKYREGERNAQSVKVVSVSKNKVGYIIGKGGIRIKNLQFESQTKIKIHQCTGTNNEISIVGSPASIAKAHEMINNLLENYKPPPPKELDNTSASTEDWDVDGTTFVPLSKYCRAVSQAYRGNTDKMLTSNMNRESHVFNRRYVGKTIKQDHNYREGGKNARSVKVISVSKNKVGYIIGKGGIRIKNLQFVSQTKIKINQCTCTNYEISIVGSPASIAKAHEMINDLLENYKPPPPKEVDNTSATTEDWDVDGTTFVPLSKYCGAVSQAYRGNTDKMLTNNMNQESHVFNRRYVGKTIKQDNNYLEGGKNARSVKVISVSKNKVGYIIGKGGIRIKNLQFVSQTKIKINQCTGTNNEISIVGSPASIAKAHEMIKNLLENYKPPLPKELHNTSEPTED